MFGHLQWLNSYIKTYLLHIKSILGTTKIKLGKRAFIDRTVCFDTSLGGEIYLGNNCVFSRGVLVLSYGGTIKIGNNFTAGAYTTLYGHGNLIIGNDVHIASHCTLIPANHIFSEKSVPIFKQGLTKKGIKIKDDVWIGTHVSVLDGVTIETGCVIGAGSVVTKSTKPNGVYAGVPAKRILDR